MQEGHSFCLIQDVASRDYGSDIWTFGFLKDVRLSSDTVVLQFGGYEVNVKVAMLEPNNYKKGELYTCLAYKKEDMSLLARILKISNELNPEAFMKCVSM